MNKIFKITLGLMIVVLLVSLSSLFLLWSLIQETVTERRDGVSKMGREERIELLEDLWNSEDFKKSTPNSRREIFESIVVE